MWFIFLLQFLLMICIMILDIALHCHQFFLCFFFPTLFENLHKNVSFWYIFSNTVYVVILIWHPYEISHVFGLQYGCQNEGRRRVYYRTSWCENTTGKSYRDFPARNSANSQITPQQQPLEQSFTSQFLTR